MSAQTVGEIEERDRLVSDQEALLNAYRCRFGVDTEVVPGGCVRGEVRDGPASSGQFVGIPTPEETYRRDHLIADQEALLNAYRCRFGVDAEVVPGGCSVWSAFTVPVFFCGPPGRFDGLDLDAAVAGLNREVSPWFAVQSSGRAHIRFVEGGVLAPEFDWPNAHVQTELMDGGLVVDGPVDAGQSDACLDSARVVDAAGWGLSPALLFVATATPRQQAAISGFASGYASVSVFPGEGGYESALHANTAAHELGHSLFGLPHIAHQDQHGNDQEFVCDLLMSQLDCGVSLEWSRLGCLNRVLLDWPTQEFPCPEKATDVYDDWFDGAISNGATLLHVGAGNLGGPGDAELSFECSLGDLGSLSAVLRIRYSAEPEVHNAARPATIAFSGGAVVALTVRESTTAWYGDGNLPDFYTLDLAVSDWAGSLLVLDVIAESAGEVMAWDIPGAPGGGLSVRMLSADDRAVLPAFRHGCDTGTVPDFDRH